MKPTIGSLGYPNCIPTKMVKRCGIDGDCNHETWWNMWIWYTNIYDLILLDRFLGDIWRFYDWSCRFEPSNMWGFNQENMRIWPTYMTYDLHWVGWREHLQATSHIHTHTPILIDFIWVLGKAFCFGMKSQILWRHLLICFDW